jgi:hypothetical protein
VGKIKTDNITIAKTIPKVTRKFHNATIAKYHRVLTNSKKKRGTIRDLFRNEVFTVSVSLHSGNSTTKPATSIHEEEHVISKQYVPVK